GLPARGLDRRDNQIHPRECETARLMLSAQDIIEAESRIRPLARETPVDRSLHLSRLGDADVYLKLEHLQHTGSFKLRGATNKILSLDGEQLRRGVIAGSTRQHGMGGCCAAPHAGTP